MSKQRSRDPGTGRQKNTEQKGWDSQVAGIIGSRQRQGCMVANTADKVATGATCRQTARQPRNETEKDQKTGARSQDQRLQPGQARAETQQTA